MSQLPSFKAIAAIDAERGLGLEGDLPWHLPEDLKHFARTTKHTQDPTRQNAVVMGRVTAETIPAKYWPLSGRKNVVVTRNPEWTIDDAEVFTDLKTALQSLGDQVESIYVVGGGQIYSLALELPACQELILTRINKSYGCDAFFPSFKDRYTLQEKMGSGTEGNVEYQFERWIQNES